MYGRARAGLRQYQPPDLLGGCPHSIADFHIKLGQAKIRTVLGRVDDTTASLNAMANDLRGSASLASQDISSQDTQIQ
ncbi:hypothetical protein [Aeromonas allosaccharophila]